MAEIRPLPPRVEPPSRQDAPRARAPGSRGLQRSWRPHPRPDVRHRHHTRGGNPRRPSGDRRRAGAPMGEARPPPTSTVPKQQGAASAAHVIEGDARQTPRLLTEEQHRQVDLIVTSPPYACQVSDVTENATSIGVGPLRRTDTTNYSPDRSNLGHARGRAYLAAMSEVYEASVAVLKPGGFLVLVTKDMRSGGRYEQPQRRHDHPLRKPRAALPAAHHRPTRHPPRQRDRDATLLLANAHRPPTPAHVASAPMSSRTRTCSSSVSPAHPARAVDPRKAD